jgi:hypothetical protein
VKIASRTARHAASLRLTASVSSVSRLAFGMLPRHSGSANFRKC